MANIGMETKDSRAPELMLISDTLDKEVQVLEERVNTIYDKLSLITNFEEPSPINMKGEASLTINTFVETMNFRLGRLGRTNSKLADILRGINKLIGT